VPTFWHDPPGVPHPRLDLQCLRSQCERSLAKYSKSKHQRRIAHVIYFTNICEDPFSSRICPAPTLCVWNSRTMQVRHHFRLGWACSRKASWSPPSKTSQSCQSNFIGPATKRLWELCLLLNIDTYTTDDEWNALAVEPCTCSTSHLAIATGSQRTTQC
jgi:hypothetical protein